MEFVEFTYLVEPCLVSKKPKEKGPGGVGEDIQRLKSPENLDFPLKKIRSITLAKIID